MYSVSTRVQFLPPIYNKYHYFQTENSNDSNETRQIAKVSIAAKTEQIYIKV